MINLLAVHLILSTV